SGRKQQVRQSVNAHQLQQGPGQGGGDQQDSTGQLVLFALRSRRHLGWRMNQQQPNENNRGGQAVCQNLRKLEPGFSQPGPRWVVNDNGNASSQQIRLGIGQVFK